MGREARASISCSTGGRSRNFTPLAFRRLLFTAPAAHSPRRWPRAWPRDSRRARRRAGRRATRGAVFERRWLSAAARRSSITSGSAQRAPPGIAAAHLCYPERVSVPLLAVTLDPLDLNRLTAAVADGGDGAIVAFWGVVRNHNGGRRVRYFEYDAYAPLALKVFERSRRGSADARAGGRRGVHPRTGRRARRA